MSPQRRNYIIYSKPFQLVCLLVVASGGPSAGSVGCSGHPARRSHQQQQQQQQQQQ